MPKNIIHNNMVYCLKRTMITTAELELHIKSPVKLWKQCIIDRWWWNSMFQLVMTSISKISYQPVWKSKLHHKCQAQTCWEAVRGFLQPLHWHAFVHPMFLDAHLHRLVAECVQPQVVSSTNNAVDGLWVSSSGSSTSVPLSFTTSFRPLSAMSGRWGWSSRALFQTSAW